MLSWLHALPEDIVRNARRSARRLLLATLAQGPDRRDRAAPGGCRAPWATGCAGRLVRMTRATQSCPRWSLPCARLSPAITMTLGLLARAERALGLVPGDFSPNQRATALSDLAGAGSGLRRGGRPRGCRRLCETITGAALAGTPVGLPARPTGWSACCGHWGACAGRMRYAARRCTSSKSREWPVCRRPAYCTWS